MSAPRQRTSADLASLPALTARFGATLFAGVAASLAAMVVILLGTVTGASAGQVLLTAAAAGVIAVVLATTGTTAVRPLPVTPRPSGVAGAVLASTAYWCALEAPRCPQRPRAPGRH